ncbi:hypothetical protein GC170_19710 [bacterium]|nr:hypothetical protein [bacterium]
MAKMIRIELSDIDLGQTLDALDTRAEAYEKTAAYLDGEPLACKFFLPEEVNDSYEARRIAEHFRSIMANIQEQWRR